MSAQDQLQAVVDLSYGYEKAYAYWRNTTLLRRHIRMSRELLEERMRAVDAERVKQRSPNQDKRAWNAWKQRLAYLNTKQTKALIKVKELEDKVVDRLVEYARDLWQKYYPTWYTVRDEDTRMIYHNTKRPATRVQAFTISIDGPSNAPPSLRAKPLPDLHYDLIPQLSWISRHKPEELLKG